MRNGQGRISYTHTEKMNIDAHCALLHCLLHSFARREAGMSGAVRSYDLALTTQGPLLLYSPLPCTPCWLYGAPVCHNPPMPSAHNFSGLALLQSRHLCACFQGSHALPGS